MLKKTVIPLAISILLGSCTMRMPADFIASPSGRYKLKVDLNRDKSNKKNYNCVLLAVCDSSYKEMSTFQTGASNTMKWAVGWYPLQDTVILNSKDIGTYAYRVSADGKLMSIPVDKAIESKGEEIFRKKYADTK
jgi:hypothetical protein